MVTMVSSFFWNFEIKKNTAVSSVLMLISAPLLMWRDRLSCDIRLLFLMKEKKQLPFSLYKENYFRGSF